MNSINKKNVYLIQVQNLIAERIFLPLAIGYLWSYVNSHKDIRAAYNLAGVFFQRKAIKEYLDVMESPEVVGISTYVWNWEFSKAIAQAIKERWPNCLIIMGGPQVSYKTGFQGELPFVDLVATYGGEDQFLEILREYQKECPNYDSILGLITPRTVQLTKRKQVSDVNKFPSPYLQGFFDRVIADNPDVNFNMIIETNRGCPYTCAFCNMFDDYYVKLRQFSMETIKAEIDWGVDRGIDYLDCADSNFGIFSRDIEIAEYIVDKKKKLGIPRMFNFTSAKNQPQHVEKIQKLFGSVGIDRGISVSLQSLNPDTLKAINRWNMSDDKLVETVSKYKRDGLESFIELILGLPMETKKSWLKGLNKIIDQGVECSLLIHPLSAVPNTPFDSSDYVERYGLKFTTTKSPAQGFCYGHESAEERERICYESNTMPFQDWLDSYVYGKCIMGVHYFHGLSFYVAKMLKKIYGIEFSTYLELLLSAYTSGEGFFSDEYFRITKAIRGSLFELKPWGRKILGDQDMYWSDQAAAAMYLIDNIDPFYNALFELLTSTFKSVSPEILNDVIRFNKSILERPDEVYPLKVQFKFNWDEFLNDREDLKNDGSQYVFNGRPWENHHDHAIHVYWFGRKSSRCFIKDIKRI